MQYSRLVAKAVRTQSSKQFEPSDSKAIRLFSQAKAQCEAVMAHSKQPVLFGGATALALCCIEIPRDIHDRGVVVVVDSRNKRYAKRGVTYETWTYPHRDVDVAGLRCVDPITVWFMLSRELSVDGLVRLGDAMTRRNAYQKWYTREGMESLFGDFMDTVQAQGRARVPAGVGKCRRALQLMRDDTDSFPETDLRLMLMSYGLPCPEVNHEVTVRRAGRRCFLDLSYPEVKVAVEYDGAQHGQQERADVERRRDLESEGWTVISVMNYDMMDVDSREMLALRVAEAIGKRLGRTVYLSAPLTSMQLTDGRRRRVMEFRLRPPKK